MSKNNRRAERKRIQKIIESEISARAKARKYAKRAGGEVRLPPDPRKYGYGVNYTMREASGKAGL